MPFPTSPSRIASSAGECAQFAQPGFASLAIEAANQPKPEETSHHGQSVQVFGVALPKLAENMVKVPLTASLSTKYKL